MYKKSHIILLISSVLFSSRIFKFLYSRYSDKDNISLTSLVTVKSNKLVMMVVSYLSMIPTLGMLIISASNLALIKTQLINGKWDKQ